VIHDGVGDMGRRDGGRRDGEEGREGGMGKEEQLRRDRGGELHDGEGEMGRGGMGKEEWLRGGGGWGKSNG